MRLSRVLLAGVAVAAAGIATSAFTAGNTFDGRTTTSPVTARLAVSGVDRHQHRRTSRTPRTPRCSTPSTFTVDRGRRGPATRRLTLLSSTTHGDAVGGAPHVRLARHDRRATPITCTLTDAPVIVQDFDKVGLTVVSQ